jgi:predicted phosphoribosyltransferase
MLDITTNFMLAIALGAEVAIMLAITLGAELAIMLVTKHPQ